jgi:hypothetical protein
MRRNYDGENYDGQALAFSPFAFYGQALAFSPLALERHIDNPDLRTPLPVCYDSGRIIWRSKRNDEAGCTLATAVQ